jgi:hypothetical protein
MELSHDHQFTPDEARARLRALGEYMQNRHGMQVTWTSDDSLHLKGKYTVVEIDAQVRLQPGRVHVQGKDPGMLMRGAAKKYVAGKLQAYLNPIEPLDSLPRG